MRHRSLQALFTYWNALRGDALAPKRTAIDPRGIATALGDVFLLDGDVETFTFRLAGSRIVEALGRDLTSTSFYSVWSDRALETAIRSLDLVAREAEPILIGAKLHLEVSASAPQTLHTPLQPAGMAGFRASSGQVRERRQPFGDHGEMILLPLEHNGQIGGRILGAFALYHPPVLRRETATQLDITGTRMLGVQAKPSAPVGLLPAEIADTVVARRGHLVLMRGMKDG